MRQLLSILLLLILASCLTQKKCNERFPPSQTTNDSIITRIVPHDSIVYLPGEILFASDSVPCPELNYKKSVTHGRLTSSISIKNGVITQECKEDSLQKIIEHWQDKYFISTHSIKQTEQPDQTHHATKWDIFCYCVTVATLSTLIVLAIIKIRP